MPIKRQELKRVIEESAVKAQCEPEVQARLVATADVVEHMAVGTYVASNAISCGCPAQVAGYVRNEEQFVGEENYCVHENAPPSVSCFIHEFDKHPVWRRIELDYMDEDAEDSTTGYIKVED